MAAFFKTMILFLLILGFGALVLTLGLSAAAKAPVGYQDEAGFHFGSHLSESRN